jgi:hypothetical protein
LWLIPVTEGQKADGLMANSSAAQAFELNTALGQEKAESVSYLHKICKDYPDTLNTGDWHGNENRPRPEPYKTIASVSMFPLMTFSAGSLTGSPG